MDASNATSALPHVDYTLGCRPYASPSIAAACAHVTNNPLCERGDTDYLRFYYCSDSFVGAAPPALKLPILALWCLVLFVAIATVAGNYFAPSVERISARLGLSEDVAGATILALGGAAPDIFTQAAALLESDTPDLRLALSESVGAGLFVSNLGKALTVLVGLSRGGRVVRRQDSNPRARVPTTSSPSKLSRTCETVSRTPSRFSSRTRPYSTASYPPARLPRSSRSTPSTWR